MTRAGWDSAETARAYEDFCRRHTRYQEANEALVAHADLAGALRVLDVAAGTGRTADAALGRLGPSASVVCLEPAGPMRALGRERMRDARARWVETWPVGRFDRVLCGAAVWAIGPFTETVERLGSLVEAGGALAFTVPAAYIGEPDEPGGGRDPLLHELPLLLANGRLSQAPPGEQLPAGTEIEALLRAAGLVPERWTLRRRQSQPELRDWLKIPVLTDALLGDLDPAVRARRVDEAYARSDTRSWRWERWAGWTARRAT